MPGKLVEIGLNSPRTSAGAFGLRSYMSMCDGPPASQTRITDFVLVLNDCPARARAANNPGSVSPPRPKAPILRNERRSNELGNAECGMRNGNPSRSAFIAFSNSAGCDHRNHIPNSEFRIPHSVQWLNINSRVF